MSKKLPPITGRVVIPVAVFESLLQAAQQKLSVAKTIIIEQDEKHTVFFTQPFNGPACVAGYSTTGFPLQSEATGRDQG